MTLNNEQISTVMLLIETSQLPEPELSEAWELLKFIQESKMKEVETNRPTCAGCQTVCECQKLPGPCPNLPATQPIKQGDK